VIWCVKLNWIGHVLRHEGFLRHITEEKNDDDVTHGRRRTELLHLMM